MQGENQVIAELNRLLAGELASIDQYLLHSRMYEDWGLNALYAHIDHEVQEERDHADRIIRRILFLEGRPDLVTRDPIRIGESVPEMLRSDLENEYRIANNLKEVIAYCESVRDFVTRDILVPLLDDTEMDHAYWLEKQLGLIERMGLANYLQTQMHDHGAAQA